MFDSLYRRLIKLAEGPRAPYALAAVAYEVLSGQRARREPNPLALAHAIANQPPPDIREAWPEAPPAAAVSPIVIAPPPTAKPANPLAASPDKPTDKANDRTSAAAGAPRPAPLPGLRSLLNSLFGSQN